MIKVNLLREQGARVEKKAVAVPKVSSMGMILLLVFVSLGAALGIWWYMVNQDMGQLRENQARLRIEAQRLNALKKQIADFEKLKKLQEGRIQVIEKLKNNQTGPVELMNHILRSLPKDAEIRLTNLDQKGDRIQITGYARRSDTIPDLMSNLGSGKLFKTVDLESIQEEKEGAKFTLICTSPGRTVAQ
jgi:type IV pilus assembly protein PilN